MWIKKTKVKTKNKEYTYIQLVQSERSQGKIHHKVLANLGHLENLEMETLHTLVDALNGANDSLDPELLCLLPTKKYGASLLLSHMLENMGIERFLSDLVRYRKMDISVSKAVTALLIYYSVNEDASFSFSDFLNQYSFPFSVTLTQELLDAALMLLSDRLIVRASLLNSGRSSLPLYQYIYYTKNSNLPKISDGAVILILLDRQNTPVDLCFMKQSYKHYSPHSADDVFISDSYRLLRQCDAFHPETSRYICRLRESELSDFFTDSYCVLTYSKSSGVFHDYNTLGFRTRNFENKTVIILRPFPGVSQRSSVGSAEPREILVSNLSDPPQQVLERYLYLERLQNYFFNLFLPCDLNFIYKKLKPRKVLYALQNLIFIKILIFHAIERRTFALGLTASDVIREFDSLESVQLNDGSHARKFHSKPTPLQINIFQCLEIPKPPTISVSSRSQNNIKKEGAVSFS